MLRPGPGFEILRRRGRLQQSQPLSRRSPVTGDPFRIAEQDHEKWSPQEVVAVEQLEPSLDGGEASGSCERRKTVDDQPLNTVEIARPGGAHDGVVDLAVLLLPGARPSRKMLDGSRPAPVVFGRKELRPQVVQAVELATIVE